MCDGKKGELTLTKLASMTDLYSAFPTASFCPGRHQFKSMLGSVRFQNHMERNGIESFLRTIPAFVSGMERNRRVPRKRIFAVGAERTRPADSARRGGTRSLTRGLIPSPPLISLPSTGTRSTMDEHGAEAAGPLSPRPERGAAAASQPEAASVGPGIERQRPWTRPAEARNQAPAARRPWTGPRRPGIERRWRKSDTAAAGFPLFRSFQSNLIYLTSDFGLVCL